MEEVEKEKVMEKGGAGKKVLLSVIFVLVVALAVLGFLIYFKGPNTKNVYLKTIDDFSSSINEVINKTDMSKLQQLDYNFSFNLNSSNTQYRDIAKILNKIKLNASMEEDHKNKKANINLDVLYNNSSMIDANIYLNNKDYYVELPTLYSKLIKLPVDDSINLDQFWNIYNKDNYKTIINELTKIIKNNLKDEYFSSSDEKINVLGKELNVSKQVLTLTGKDIFNMETSIINDLLNNEKLLNALSETANIPVADLKTELNNAKSELTEENGKLTIELYLNKVSQKLEYALFITDTEKLELSKTSEDTFNIIYNNEKLGTISLINKGIDLMLNYENNTINIKFTENTIKISIITDEAKININVTENNKKGNAVININILKEKIDLTINLDYELKYINNIKSKDYSNYVEMDKMTEDDYNSIMTKLYENEALVTLIQDISNITGNLFNNQLY